MKGLHVVVDASPISFPEGRGFRRHVLSLLSALRENGRTNRYSFLSCDRAIGSFFPRQDSCFRFQHPRRRIPWLHRRSAWTKPLGKFFLADVDVVHFPCSDIWLGPPRAASVVTLHDFTPLYVPERFFKTAKEEKDYRFLLNRIAENATLLVTVSHHTRHEALKHLGIEPGRVRTVYNATDPLFLQETASVPSRELESLGLPESFFLFVGALDFRKNLSLLLEAFSWYRSKDGTASLVLVGRQDPQDPKFFPLFESLLEKSKYKKSILWLDRISDPLLPQIYSKATALIFSSTHEGFGYPLVEAMACGTPVIATRTTCLPEIVGEAGLLVEPSVELLGEAMRRVESDSSLRQRLKELGKQRLGLFLPERLAQEMLEVYQQASACYKK